MHRQRKFIERHRKLYNEWLRRPAGRYLALRTAAKRAGLGFDIPREHHAKLLLLSCTYCGGPLNESGHGVDRKDPSMGYVKTNVVPCCVTCNRIKNKLLTFDEMKVAMLAVMEHRRAEHAVEGRAHMQVPAA
jgi:5-methylcytosine-specific restriction endonuclease McrA